MKNLITILLVMFFFASHAQDVLHKNNGEKILCKVLEITPELVKFKKTAISESPIYTMYKSEVKMIIFSGGYKEIFDNPEEEGFNNGLELFIDIRDSTKYQIVKIGEQIWFAENLIYETENSMCYRNKLEYCKKYGKLYNFKEAVEACPDGWHLPNDEEWKKLEMHLGMFEKVDEAGWRGNSPGQGQLLKKGGSSGFNAEMGGSRRDKTFWNVNNETYFWTSSKSLRYNNYAWIRYLNERASIKRELEINSSLLSVRCIKDI